MDDLKRALAASRADRDGISEEERQLQEAIHLSRLDQANISTASDTAGETASDSESTANHLIQRNQTKRNAEEGLSSTRTKMARPITPPGPSRNRMKFPNGAVRITRTPGRQNAKNCVNLDDIIDKKYLVSACIFSFFIGDEELFQHLPFSHSSDAIPIYIGRDPNMDPMVRIACEEADQTIKNKLTRKQLDIVSASLDRLYKAQYGKNYHAFYAWSSGSSHSKILVLIYPKFLRFVITSCNMMDLDTLDGDNQWYIHDVPKFSIKREGHPSQFEEDLLAHLRALKSPETFIESIEGLYDYSKVQVHLCTSVPGTWAGPKAEQHGLLRLRRIVKELDLDLAEKKARGKLQLEVCAASIGNLNTKWLNGFYDCALGKEDLEVANSASIVPDLKLFYPSVSDVKSAHESAQQGANNIGCHTRPWSAVPNDIKRLFHHYQSKDTGRLFHQKLILAYNPQDVTTLPYYVYLGSANLSQSAWGALEVDKKENEATCNSKLVKMSNLECGVVIPGKSIKDLLEPGTKSWVDGIVPHHQNARQYDLPKHKPWNDPRWVQNYREDYVG